MAGSFEALIGETIVTFAATGASKIMDNAFLNLGDSHGSPLFVFDRESKSAAIIARTWGAPGQFIVMLDPFGVTGTFSGALNGVGARTHELTGMLFGGTDAVCWDDAARERSRSLLFYVAGHPSEGCSSTAGLCRVVTVSKGSFGQAPKGISEWVAMTHLGWSQRRCGLILSTTLRAADWLDITRIYAGHATRSVPVTVNSSPDNTVVLAGSTSAITDASANGWTLTAGGQVALSGVVDTTTAGAIKLAFEKGLIWQENSNDYRWSKSSPSTAWGPTGGTATSPAPVTVNPSPDNTVALAGSTSATTDASDNEWTLTAGGQVALSGVADMTTAGVIELAYEKGLIWQENSNDYWWSKSPPSAARGPTGHLRVPVRAAVSSLCLGFGASHENADLFTLACSAYRYGLIQNAMTMGVS